MKVKYYAVRYKEKGEWYYCKCGRNKPWLYINKDDAKTAKSRIDDLWAAQGAEVVTVEVELP